MVVYNNPFFVVPAVSSTTVVQVPVWQNYSVPLQAPANELVEDLEAMDAEGEGTASEGALPADPELDEPMALFDEAREEFENEDFARALELVDQALDLLPSDATLHEFRALCLFAMKDYQQAAAAIYAVLSAGPGWNWETLASLYRNIDTHTQQLRALEAHVRANPDDAAAIFLLAYQYMTMGHLDAAVTRWEQVSRLLPDDALTAQLLDAFRPDVAAPAAPASPQ